MLKIPGKHGGRERERRYRKSDKEGRGGGANLKSSAEFFQLVQVADFGGMGGGTLPCALGMIIGRCSPLIYLRSWGEGEGEEGWGCSILVFVSYSVLDGVINVIIWFDAISNRINGHCVPIITNLRLQKRSKKTSVTHIIWIFLFYLY